MDERLRKVQHSHATYYLLRRINEGRTAIQIAREFKVDRASISKRIARFKSKGWVVEGIRTSFKELKLTSSGKDLLNELQHVLKGLGSATLTKDFTVTFRWHHLIFKIPIIKQQPGMFESMQKKGAFYTQRGPKNIRGWEVNIDSTPVFLTGSSFLIYPRPITAGSINEAVATGLTQLDAIYSKLLRWFPYADLSYKKELCRQHLAMVGGITTLIPDKFNYKSDRLLIDCSTGVPEIETPHKVYSVEDMTKIVAFLDSLIKNDLVESKP